MNNDGMVIGLLCGLLVSMILLITFVDPPHEVRRKLLERMCTASQMDTTVVVSDGFVYRCENRELFMRAKK